jgi:signal transduction histidine kinase
MIIDIMKKGVFDYIIKPVRAGDLLVKIERAFMVYLARSDERTVERDRVIRELFRNLQRSFNQGAGLGTQITLSRMIVDTAMNEDDRYYIDKRLFNLIMENQNMAEMAISRFAEIERIMANALKAEEINCGELYHLIDSVRLDMKEFEKINGHTITLKGHDPSLDKYKINVNINYITEIVSELLINAMKFSRSGSEVGMIFSIEDNQAVLNIENTPFSSSRDVPGIPPEMERSIFEPLFRVSNFVREGYRTLDFGLGLTGVEKMVRLHGGTIWLGNSNGEELKVRCVVRLPIAAGQ